MADSKGLTVRGLTVAYGKHRALEDVALTVRPGEIAVILGANGAGKSTLLKSVAGICEGRVSGTILMDGEPLAGLPAHTVVERGIALVPEGRGIFGDLTVRENLALGAHPGRARDDRQANLDRLFKLFPKLRERAGQVARTMSGGEQQMVAIGRAMMSNPTILMLDEPSLGLSPLLCKELFASLAEVRKAGLGILLVEQNAKQSLAIADRGYLLENGQIVHQAGAKALIDDPAVQAAYLGAGGQAAPHVGQPDVDAGPGPAAVAAGAADPAPSTLPERPAPRPPARPAPAGALAGVDIADLVSRAGSGYRRHIETRQTPPGGLDGAPGRPTGKLSQALAATLAEIERAAADARHRVQVELRPLPPLRDPSSAGRTGSAAVSSPRPAAQDRPAQPVIEIWRAPRVEVWRRRPGSDSFDRKEEV